MIASRLFRSRAVCGIGRIIGTSITAVMAHIFISIYRPIPKTLQVPLLIAVIIAAIEETCTVLAWIGYGPTKPCHDDKTLPSLTVVVPAYNESSFVQFAMISILQSDYPRGKLQVLVVDDGSTDDTWEHIMAAAATLNNAGVLCSAHQHPRNAGKRAAICTGFRLARGQIIVSLDSDSVLERQALRNIVAPMMNDARIGGVAGHLMALNVQNSTLPRLLDILFDAGGNVPRAAQSYLGGFVTILPGAMSAFRASAVAPLLDGLCASKFLNVPLRHGEDIELTLGLLQRGWTTKYQSNAVVYTTVPETALGTILMYTRWERSSYVYICMGFLSTAIKSILHQAWPSSHHSKVPDTKERTAQRGDRPETPGGKFSSNHTSAGHLAGSIYLLLNLVTTAVSNHLLIVFFLMQVRNAISYPATIPASIAVTAFQSFWRGVLFIPESLERDRHAESFGIKAGAIACERYSRGTKTGGTILIEDRRSRLFWRLQYSIIAGVFQMIFVSWSSVLALMSLRSQCWLTR